MRHRYLLGVKRSQVQILSARHFDQQKRWCLRRREARNRPWTTTRTTTRSIARRRRGRCDGDLGSPAGDRHDCRRHTDEDVAQEFQYVTRGGRVGIEVNGLDALVLPFDTDAPTTLRTAISTMQTLGEVPTAWCLNPVDAENIDLTRWGIQGGFLSGGYEHDTGNGFGPSANIFGPDSIARVVTPHLPQGTTLLADFDQLLLAFQQYMRLDIDAYTGFDMNAVRFRVASFVGVGILRPQAFAVIDLGAGTTTAGNRSKSK